MCFLSRLMCLIVCLAAAVPLSAQPSQPAIPAAQLVRETVFNERNDHQGHGSWRYWIERQEGRETLLEEQVETAEGPINRLNEANGRPLSDQRRRNEEARIGELLRSTGGQRQARQSYQEDERRVGHILALLADAFVYEDQGQENGCRRLGFRPDPAYQARSVEARVFHAMRGTLWINTRLKRLVRLDGEVAENLDFGYGLLGRLNKGGWFRMERRAVSATEWKTVRLEIHMSGRALLVKSFARETSERRGGFQPVSAGLSLAQGAALLDPMAAYSADRKVAERLLRR